MQASTNFLIRFLKQYTKVTPYVPIYLKAGTLYA